MEANTTNPQENENGTDSHLEFSTLDRTDKFSVDNTAQSQENSQIDVTSLWRKCGSCSNGTSTFTRKGHTQYRCDTCKLLINGTNRFCKNHPQAGFYPNDHPEKEVTRSCHVCHGTGLLESRPAVTIGTTLSANNNADISSNKSTATPGMVKAIDKLQKTIKFDRKFMRIISDTSGNPLKLIKAVVQHVKKYQPKVAIEAFRKAWLPEGVMEEITSQTNCDKWVEKTKIGNVIMCALTMFLENKTEALTIQDIADASTSLLGRTLSPEEDSVDHNSLGVRLEKPQLIRGLEMLLQLCNSQLSTNISNAFEENGTLLNIYYDWFYLVKSGNEWQVCQELGRTKESYGLKIGIGIEWESKAIVALTVHGERHGNDAVSFREELMLSQRAGLVHITDLGPFSSETMIKIHKARQYFIIKLKSKVKYQHVHQIFLGNYTFQLETASKTKIRVLEEKLIRLEVNPELGDLKYIRFQYNSLKTGQFKTIEVITSLPLSAEEIIRAHA